MLNNPYVPGDPYSYDLKWLVAKVKEILAQLGTLDEAIETKIFEGFLEHSIVQFKTVAEMLAADIKDGSIVLTLGYHEAGDLGGLFYLVKDFNPSQCALDYFLTLDNNSQIAIPIIVTPYVTPEMFGAYGDGSTDDGKAIQNAIDTGIPVLMANNDYAIEQQLDFDQLYILNSQITMRNVDPYGLKANYLKADNITIVGPETYADAAGTPAASVNFGIVADTAEIERATFSGLRNGVDLKHGYVKFSTFNGVLVSGHSYPNGNYCSFVRVDAGNSVTVEGCIVKDTGNSVLAGHDSENVIVKGLTIDGAWDNGIYLSSVKGYEVSDCTIEKCTYQGSSSAIKARGPRGLISRNKITNSSQGISISPTLENNADCITIENNEISATTRCIVGRKYEDSNATTIRNVKILNNRLVNSGPASSDESAIDIRSTAGIENIEISGNVVNSALSTCVSVYDAKNWKISGNVFNKKVFFERGENIEVSGNISEDVIGEFRSIVNLAVLENVANGITFSSSYLNTNMRIIGNIFSTSGNLNGNTFGVEHVIENNRGYWLSANPATTTPYYVGQTNRLGGQIYIGKGVTSSSDWVLIG